jgi:hypothetical protein
MAISFDMQSVYLWVLFPFLRHNKQDGGTKLCDALVRIANGADVALCDVFSTITFLTQSAVPFDISFVPATRKYASSFQLTVHINPTKTEVFVISLTAGPSVFSPVP